MWGYFYFLPPPKKSGVQIYPSPNFRNPKIGAIFYHRPRPSPTSNPKSEVEINTHPIQLSKSRKWGWNFHPPHSNFRNYESVVIFASRQKSRGWNLPPPTSEIQMLFSTLPLQPHLGNNPPKKAIWDWHLPLFCATHISIIPLPRILRYLELSPLSRCSNWRSN